MKAAGEAARQPQRHRRHLGVAGLGDGHHLVALAAVDRGRVGRVQRPGRLGEQVGGLLRLEAGGQRTGHPDYVGGPLQGRLLAWDAPQLTRANAAAR